MAICRSGDQVLLRVECVGEGSDGPYVRVETGWGGAIYFTVAKHAIARVERATVLLKEPEIAKP